MVKFQQHLQIQGNKKPCQSNTRAKTLWSAAFKTREGYLDLRYLNPVILRKKTPLLELVIIHKQTKLWPPRSKLRLKWSLSNSQIRNSSKIFWREKRIKKLSSLRLFCMELICLSIRKESSRILRGHLVNLSPRAAFKWQLWKMIRTSLIVSSTAWMLPTMRALQWSKMWTSSASWSFQLIAHGKDTLILSCSLPLFIILLVRHITPHLANPRSSTQTLS